MAVGHAPGGNRQQGRAERKHGKDNADPPGRQALVQHAQWRRKAYSLDAGVQADLAGDHRGERIAGAPHGTGS